MGGWDLAAWRRLVFDLCYSLHGGSGLSWTPGDVERMLLRDSLAFHRMLLDQRDDESRQLAKQRSKG